MAQEVAAASEQGLRRGIGVLQATALNVTFVVGAGVFATIPNMLGVLPGPYALLAWIAGGLLIFLDGLVWSELGAAMPGSGGTYHYLLASFGRERWGRLAAFLFIWQFLLSGPLELGSGLVAISLFSTALSPGFQAFNEAHTHSYPIWAAQSLTITIGPSRLLALAFGVIIILMLARNITSLGKLTVTFWIGVLAAAAWIMIEGWARFDPSKAFAFTGAASHPPAHLPGALGQGMVLALYSYLGYYNVCYIGDEVREPGRTIPRSIIASVLIVVGLFLLIHLALLGTIPWQQVSPSETNLAATFMRHIHGDWAATAITLLLVWCCFGSVFAGMLGYSRIPFGAARDGAFYRMFATIHPRREAPHYSLLLIGGLTLFWGFFDLSTVINALITTRILEQFVAQIIGLVLLRRNRPDLYRPYKMWLYPLPAGLALVGWLFVYYQAGWLYILLGATTLVAGVFAFLLFAARSYRWPFPLPPEIQP